MPRHIVLLLQVHLIHCHILLCASCRSFFLSFKFKVALLAWPLICTPDFTHFCFGLYCSTKPKCSICKNGKLRKTAFVVVVWLLFWHIYQHSHKLQQLLWWWHTAQKGQPGCSNPLNTWCSDMRPLRHITNPQVICIKITEKKDPHNYRASLRNMTFVFFTNDSCFYI